MWRRKKRTRCGIVWSEAVASYRGALGYLRMQRRIKLKLPWKMGFSLLLFLRWK
ncbi:hypothetical protein Golax_023685 [Gossypium laxum]|uniref:Uncharacterized protein n=1 Tax=Gossypium laxum TaxID=34288 RepID=A0A7J8Z9V8_9ROSI|nr:hypothetical protein [Gossypium laxum]